VVILTRPVLCYSISDGMAWVIWRFAEGIVGYEESPALVDEAYGVLRSLDRSLLSKDNI
jgi:hypothetical protein